MAMTDFDFMLTEEQIELRNLFRDFAQKSKSPAASRKNWASVRNIWSKRPSIWAFP